MVASGWTVVGKSRYLAADEAWMAMVEGSRDGPTLRQLNVAGLHHKLLVAIFRSGDVNDAAFYADLPRVRRDAQVRVVVNDMCK